MSDAIDRTWPNNAWLTYNVATGCWGKQTFPQTTEYIRVDISEAKAAAARAEGERIGMGRAAGILEGYASPENSMMADAIRAAMDAKPPHPEYPSDADIDRSLSTARLLP